MHCLPWIWYSRSWTRKRASEAGHQPENSMDPRKCRATPRIDEGNGDIASGDYELKSNCLHQSICHRHGKFIEASDIRFSREEAIDFILRCFVEGQVWGKGQPLNAVQRAHYVVRLESEPFHCMHTGRQLQFFRSSMPDSWPCRVTDQFQHLEWLDEAREAFWTRFKKKV